MVSSKTPVEIVPGNKVPLYLQVAQVIKKRVRTGTYRSDAPLPSLRHLGKEFGVTASIVHRAIRELERHGIVETHHGKGIVLTADEPCEKAAVIFGFVHPYTASDEFQQSVLGYVNEAFENRANLVVTRTSKNDPALEREAAEHLIGNGVKGLLVWGINDDTNGRYFTELAKNIPVVLVDRFMRGSDLPAVVADHHAAGEDIGRHMLDTLGRKRLLVFMDNLRISAYDEMIDGFRDAARNLGRVGDVTIHQYPMHDILGPTQHRDYSLVHEYHRRAERMLREDGYDAIFTNNGQFLDRVIVETGLADEFTGLQLATLSVHGVHTGSYRFTQLAPLQWDMDVPAMVAAAADILQKQILGRRKEDNKVVRLPFQRLRKYDT